MARMLHVFWSNPAGSIDGAGKARRHDRAPKTKLVETMGIVLGLDARRIQFTPDLMPSDILGSEVLDESPGGTGRWQTCRQKRKGGFAVGGGEPPFGMKGRHGAGLGKQEGGVSFMMPEMPGTPEPWLWL